MNIAREIRLLEDLTVAELKARYAELYGEESRSGNLPYLRRKIAWRLQALDEGDLTERARRRAAELANDADLRIRPSVTEVRRAPRVAKQAELAGPPATGDRRLPPPGSVLARTYKGREVAVRVLADGFEYEGQVYRTLSAVAEVVTGGHWNGFGFFGLAPRRGER